MRVQLDTPIEKHSSKPILTRELIEKQIEFSEKSPAKKIKLDTKEKLHTPATARGYHRQESADGSDVSNPELVSKVKQKSWNTGRTIVACPVCKKEFNRCANMNRHVKAQ